MSDSDDSLQSTRVPTPDNYHITSTSLMASLSSFFPESYFVSSKDNDKGLVRTSLIATTNESDRLDATEEERNFLSSAITDLFSFTDSYSESPAVNSLDSSLSDSPSSSERAPVAKAFQEKEEDLAVLLTVTKEPNSDPGIVLTPSPDDSSVVKEVIKSSPAHRAGIKKGDRLVEVNGQTVAGQTLSDVKQRLKSPGGVIKVLLHRRRTHRDHTKHQLLKESRSLAPHPPSPHLSRAHRLSPQPWFGLDRRSNSCDNLLLSVDNKPRSRRATFTHHSRSPSSLKLKRRPVAATPSQGDSQVVAMEVNV